MSNTIPLEEFCKILPKIELHAHLNGSLSQRTLVDLQRLHAEAGRPDKTNVFMEEFRIASGDAKTLDDCFKVFGIAHALTDTPDALELATIRTLEEFEADNCIYLELRSTPRNTAHMTQHQYLLAVIEGIRKCSQRMHMVTKLIVSLNRSFSGEMADQVAELTIEMSRLYPDIVKGIDLSGDPTVNTFWNFIPALEKVRKAGLKVTIHCAEVRNEQEILSILEFCPDRIGHAVCIHPKAYGNELLWKRLKESKIPVEICLSSNIKSMLYKNYESHHFRDFYYSNVPVCICTDDKGVFETTLSKEFCIASETFGLSRTQLARICLETTQYIFSESDKNRLQDIVLKFAHMQRL